ncbi:MAG: ribosomal RNA small subunit methyltransferase A [Elusimicrobia bacterium]|nr:ribosomal RNA small subunit methyltransferase A [Elusimicrobiota bacterium]
MSSPAALHIVDSLRLESDDRVIEIGPGRGALTLHLLSRCASLTAVELDHSLADTLIARWGHEPHFKVAQGDFLDWAVPPVEGRSYKVIGNLPYSAAAAIIQKVLSWAGWDRAVFMVQKEVAARITAVPGGKNWGLLALSVQSRAKARRLFDLRPGAFRPVPKVTSTVIELERLVEPSVAHLDAFFKVAHAAFGQRRKTLVNSLSHGLALERTAVEAVLAGLDIDPGRRAETLTLEEFNRLAQRLGGAPLSVLG